jgi:hypothetical protein
MTNAMAKPAAAVRALVIAPPLVHRLAVLHHVALLREEAAAVGALVAPLLRARVCVAVARRMELGEAAGIQVVQQLYSLLVLLEQL